MGKIAFLFPGQASQYPGMGRDLAEHFPESRAVFDEADAALGFSISKLCFEGSEEALKQTENTQPAILTVSIAAYRALEKRGIVPDFAAGHSLGRVFGRGFRGRDRFSGRGENRARARTIHAGSCSFRRRRDGCDSWFATGGSG